MADKSEWKRVDEISCFTDGNKWKCFAKSGLVTKGFGNITQICFRDVPDIMVEHEFIKVVPTTTDVEYKLITKGANYFHIRRK